MYSSPFDNTAMDCRMVTIILSITLIINITEYTLFSINGKRFLKKYAQHNNIEKKIEHAGNNIPLISRASYYYLYYITVFKQKEKDYK